MRAIPRFLAPSILKSSQRGKFAPEPYFLDEPTTGLHLQDTQQLIDLFEELVDKGNTLILIEHNLKLISRADWLVDMGPDAGKFGGQVCFEGHPKDSLNDKNSRTGAALAAIIS